MREAMQLVACPVCHAQYDVAGVAARTFACRCGAEVACEPHSAVDASVERCGACGALASAEAERCEYCGAEIVRDVDRLSLICPECYARTPEDSRFCTACGVPYEPQPVPTEGRELPCPACSCPMPPHQVGGVGVNECAQCHGLWVPGECFELLVSRAIEARRNADPTRLETLRPRVTGANPSAQRVQYRKCPECDGFMARRNFRRSSGVVIDTCNTHGTWLDADELERIAGFILAGGEPAQSLEPAPSPGRRESDAAFARIVAENRGLSRRRDEPGGFVGSLVDVLSALLR